MKKISFFLSVLVLLSALPAYADFCTNCGKNLPAQANFCPSCGKAAAGAFQNVEPENKGTTPTSGVLPNSSINAAFAEYDFINKIEENLTQSNSTAALRIAQELKRKNSQKLRDMEEEYINYSIYRRKIHDLHIKKLGAMENYLEAQKAKDRRRETAKSKAQMDKELFIIDKMNEALDMLATDGNSLININKVEDLEKKVKKSTADYIVTASYLTLGNVRVRRNEPIWIEDVSGASAKVHHMGTSVSDEPAVGYVSVYDLERRTNWTADSSFYYSNPSGSTVILTQPVRPEPSVNVVIWDGIYPYRRYPHRPPIFWPSFPPPPHPRRPPHKHRPAPPPHGRGPGHHPRPNR